LIAGKLIKSGRKFISKLQEDWAYKEEYNEQRKGLRLWLGAHSRERKSKKGQMRRALVRRGLLK